MTDAIACKLLTDVFCIYVELLLTLPFSNMAIVVVVIIITKILITATI